ncbi:hypothetical protein GJ496_012018 [Pomphorhynchus laevis]|nr:hypothetical protein GJ496_012018 [Pomphorhynchus laevis]
MSNQQERFIGLIERRLSRFVGKLMNLQLPHFIYNPFCKLFCWVNNIRDYEPNQFSSLTSMNSIFTRVNDSRHSCLTIDCCNHSQLMSPVEGIVSELGKISPDEEILNVEVKQSQFSIDLRKRLHRNSNMFFIGIYLSPSDNHHFNSATDWRVNERIHYPGFLTSVRPNKIRKLEANERVSYNGKWLHGFFSMTMIGAINVGSIHVSEDYTLNTNSKSDDIHLYDGIVHQRSIDLHVNKAQPFGYFSMGSYVFIAFEAPKTFQFNCTVGQRLKQGFSLGSVIF